MATLRAIVDGRTIDAQAAAPKPKKPTGTPSPAAQHVGKQLQDPFGQTKELFDDINQKKMEYELAKQNLINQTAPTKAVLDQVSQIHTLDQSPVSMTPNLQPNPQDAGMGYDDPNNPQDPNDPNQTMGGGGGGGMPPGKGVGMTPPGKGAMPPQNMGQTPGQMNMNRPSQSGFQPGVAPGFPSQSVRPDPMGRPQPGQSNVGTKAGFPAGWTKNEPNPQMQQYNPQAQPPNGSKQLPGAQGPNDPKVQNQVKKAQGKPTGKGQKTPGEPGGKSNSSGKVNIQVHADRAMAGSRMPMAAWAGVDALRSCNDGRKMDAYTGGGMSGKNPKGTTTFSTNGPGNMPNAGNSMKAKRFKATFSKKEMEARRNMKSYGTRLGVEREWESRHHKFSDAQLDKKDTDRQVKNDLKDWRKPKMNAGGPGSGRRPSGGLTPGALGERAAWKDDQERFGGGRPGDDMGTYQVNKDKEQINQKSGGKPNKDFYGYGTSSGVEKEWQVRQRGSTNPQVKERFSDWRNKGKDNNYGWKKKMNARMENLTQ